jgi:hypothetical protein
MSASAPIAWRLRNAFAKPKIAIVTAPDAQKLAKAMIGPSREFAIARTQGHAGEEHHATEAQS